MRTFVCGSLFIIVAGMMSGCASGTRADVDKGADANSGATPSGKADTCVMQAGGSSVLRLTMSPDMKCTARDGLLQIKSPDFEVEVWLVPGAQTVDEAVGRVNTQIASEFKDFKPNQTADLTIAGSPAKRLIGPGHEADDGDDGSADVIVFKVGGHVFVACTHDERLLPAAHQGILKLVQTAEAP